MPGSPKPDPWYAIRRRDGPWGVTFQVLLKRQGKTYLRLFRTKDYPSEAAALRSARRWRDEQAVALKPLTRREFSQRLNPRNTSGTPGVYLQRSVVNGRDYFFWQARSPDGGQRCKTRSFSVTKYGYDEAYALAVKARAEFVAEVQGYIAVCNIPPKFRPHP